MKATWNNQILAESDNTIIIEGNHYFPPSSVNMKFFKESETKTTCPWKGEATYYSVFVDGKENKDAAWHYPSPKDAAEEIKNHIAFSPGVEVTE